MIRTIDVDGEEKIKRRENGPLDLSLVRVTVRKTIISRLLNHFGPFSYESITYNN